MENKKLDVMLKKLNKLSKEDLMKLLIRYSDDNKSSIMISCKLGFVKNEQAVYLFGNISDQIIGNCVFDGKNSPCNRSLTIASRYSG